MKPGVLVISHGSRVSDWVSHVDDAVGAVRLERKFAGSEKGTAGAGLEQGAGTGPSADRDAGANGILTTVSNADSVSSTVPVEVAFLELVEGRLIQDGIDRLEAKGVTDLLVIPLFVSSGSKHVSEIGWALGAYATSLVDTELERFRVQAALTYGKPIDADPEIVEVLLDRLSVLSDGDGSGGDPADATVLLIGHGSEHAGLHEAWRQGLTALASAVQIRGGYADAEIAMLRPDMIADAAGRLRARRPGCKVMALPVFLSEGYFTREVVPRRLAGLDCRYAGRTLMPHPLIARWIHRQAMAWLELRGYT